MTNPETVVTATRLDDNQRANAFSKHFGRQLMAVEAGIMYFARKLCPEYNGGYWEFYELSNGGFFMAPNPLDKVWKVEGAPNGYTGTLSSEAVGIMVCLFAYSHLSFDFSEKGLDAATEGLAQHHSDLMDYLCQHKEASELLSAVD